jgi:molybdopterin-guanine dinucleotide biosynthesis protein A
MLGVVRDAAEATGLPVRVIRRDAVRRCGPLGGVFTGLKRFRAPALIFLACDMPLVSEGLIRWVLGRYRSAGRPVFVSAGHDCGPGFPFILPGSAVEAVERQISGGQFSLNALAKKLGAKIVQPPVSWRGQLANVNDAQDLAAVRAWRGNVAAERARPRAQQR